MSELLPYEQKLQQQWIELPLPDENMAWADMKRRLEEDDDDGIIAWWRRGCVVWGIVLLTALGITWWIGQSQNWFTSASDKTTEQPGDSVTKKIPSNQTETTRTTTTNNQQQPADPSAGATPDPRKQNNGNTVTSGSEQQTNSSIVNTRPTGTGRTGRTSKEKNNTVNRVSNSSTTITTSESARRNRAGEKDPAQVSFSSQSPKTGKKPATGKDETEKNGNRKDVVKSNRKDYYAEKEIPAQNNVVPPADSIINTVRSTPDSSAKKIDSSISKTKTEEKPAVAKKDSTKKNTHFFSAGIAIHQLIPIDGQKATPYNSLGRKGSLADYIPSAYFRYNKTDKWFVQAEIRYGAPQYTKEFVYKQSKIPGQTFTDSSSFKLQKTYYHQLPLTFNYYILKNWSLGTGIIWNRFSSAVSEVEHYRRANTSTIDSLQSIEISKEKGDSLFSKSYFQAAFETHFQWKRLSVGARYSFGLQPYIKFRLPNGIQREERNSSLQVFLRYDLWRSKKK